MAAKGFRAGKSYKNQYKNYVNNGSFEANKLAKLERTVKLQPNNGQAYEALQKALKQGCTYSRNKKSSGNKCKGKDTVLGWIKNHTNKLNQYKIRFSHIWHVSSNYSKWFGPTPAKGTRVESSKTMLDQFVDAGYKVYGRKR